MVNTDYVIYTFSQLQPFLGGFGTWFLYTLFTIILLRIGFSFVFRVLKGNHDYKALLKKTGK